MAGELKKMVAFIKQEAVEKAREIEIKADEESAIEKSKLVRQETATIDTHYGRKFKQAELSQQIARSTVTNKTRLKVLAARQHLLDHIFEHARGELHNISKDETNYTNVLTNLILEGLFALSEDNVQVRSRNKDAAVLNAALIQAAKEYKEMSGQEISITLDEINTLPEDSYVSQGSSIANRVLITYLGMVVSLLLELVGKSPSTTPWTSAWRLSNKTVCL